MIVNYCVWKWNSILKSLNLFTLYLLGINSISNHHAVILSRAANYLRKKYSRDDNVVDDMNTFHGLLTEDAEVEEGNPSKIYCLEGINWLSLEQLMVSIVSLGVYLVLICF